MLNMASVFTFPFITQENAYGALLCSSDGMNELLKAFTLTIS